MILTDSQVENWRKVLLLQFGPYALIMSREQIQAYRDRMQDIADTSVGEETDQELPKNSDSRFRNGRF